MSQTPLTMAEAEAYFDPMEKSALARRFRGFLPVVVDLETGGFNARTDAILEVAATFLTMDEEDTLLPEQTLAFQVAPFPGANIEQSALDFTGIDPYHPERQAEAESDVFTKLFREVRHAVRHHGCTRAILVGHNANFDLGFLNAAAERANIKRNPFHPFSTFDTASLAALAYGQTVLAKACKTAGMEFDARQAHSAAYDAEKTAELFCRIVNRWKELGGWPLPPPARG